MDFMFGILAGVVFCTFVGVILVQNFGWTHPPEKSGSEGNISPIRKLLVSVPFLTLFIFTLVCLILSVVNEIIFFKGEADGFVSFLANPKTWLAFSKELFFAGFIALVIIVVVEVSSTEEQFEMLETFTAATREKVIEDIYKSAVDPEIFDEVVETIFQADFVREAHYRSLVLEPIEGREDKILMKVRQTYVVRNITKSPKYSVQRFFIPNSAHQFPTHNRITKMSITSLEGENDIPKMFPYEIAESQTVTINDERPDPNDLIVEETNSGAEVCYKFPAVKVVEQGRIRIELEMQLLKDRSDNEILTFLSPTLKGNISVHCLLPDLDVKAISLHRGTLEETKDGDESFKRWFFNRPMLPYQGYVVMWSKKSEYN